MIKRLIKIANFLDATITRIAIYAGLSFLVVLAIAGYAYLSQGIEPPSLDLVLFTAGWRAYLWVALPVLWAMAKTLKWGLQIRNWWVHTDEHKLRTGIRGVISWRFNA